MIKASLKQKINNSILLFILLCLSTCAHVEAPPGGPEDVTSPQLKGISPNPGALNQPKDLKVMLEFTEWVKDDLHRNKVFISPALPQKLKFNFKGKKIEVTCGSPLKEETTYILTIINSIQDLHRHHLKKSYQLVFSTGSHLDSGRIKGQVENVNKAGVYVALYPLGARRSSLVHLTEPGEKVPDSLPHLKKERPMYLIRADSLGIFDYKGIKEANYSVLAFEDLNGNLKPDVGIERVGIGQGVFELGSENLQIELFLSEYDTNRVVSGELQWMGEELKRKEGVALMSGSIQITWSKPSKVRHFKVENFLLQDKDSTEYKVIELDTMGTTMSLWIQDLAADKEYDLYALPNGKKEEIESVFKYKIGSFDLTEKVDTTQQKYAPLSFLNHGRDVSFSQPLIFGTTHYLSEQALLELKESLILEQKDSAKVDTLNVMIKRTGFHSFSLQVDSIDYTGKPMTLRLKSDSILDSTVVVQPLASWTLMDKKNWGKCKIKTKKLRGDWQYELIFLSAKKKAKKGEGQKRVYPQKSLSDGLEMSDLPSGAYFLSYYKDENKNGKWDKGSLNPWVQQEMKRVYQDTIKIKPQETTEVNVP